MRVRDIDCRLIENVLSAMKSGSWPLGDSIERTFGAFGSTAVVNERAEKPWAEGRAASKRRMLIFDNMVDSPETVVAVKQARAGKMHSVSWPISRRLNWPELGEVHTARLLAHPSYVSPRPHQQPHPFIMAGNSAPNKSIIPLTLNEPLATAPPTSTCSALAQSPYPAWSTSALL